MSYYNFTVNAVFITYSQQTIKFHARPIPSILQPNFGGKGLQGNSAMPLTLPAFKDIGEAALQPVKHAVTAGGSSLFFQHCGSSGAVDRHKNLFRPAGKRTGVCPGKNQLPVGNATNPAITVAEGRMILAGINQFPDIIRQFIPGGTFNRRTQRAVTFRLQAG